MTTQLERDHAQLLLDIGGYLTTEAMLLKRKGESVDRLASLAARLDAMIASASVIGADSRARITTPTSRLDAALVNERKTIAEAVAERARVLPAFARTVDAIITRLEQQRTAAAVGKGSDYAKGAAYAFARAIEIIHGHVAGEAVLGDNAAWATDVRARAKAARAPSAIERGVAAVLTTYGEESVSHRPEDEDPARLADQATDRAFAEAAAAVGSAAPETVETSAAIAKLSRAWGVVGVTGNGERLRSGAPLRVRGVPPGGPPTDQPADPGDLVAIPRELIREIARALADEAEEDKGWPGLDSSIAWRLLKDLEKLGIVPQDGD